MEDPCFNISGLLLDNLYILESKICTGFSSKVYRVKNSFTEKEYIAKIFNKNKVSSWENEIKYNEIISKFQNPFFIQYISSSTGLLEKDGSKRYMCNYIIFELASKGSIYNYIKYNNTGFNETICKVIFFKILKAIQALHNIGISHRNLNINNILLDENFNIKISNFGHSSFIKGEKGQNSRNDNFISFSDIIPVDKRLKYSGDIFNLGVILFNLGTGKIPFPKDSLKNNGNINSNFYKFIENKKFDKFWKLLEINGTIKGLSQEFKNLFIKMVSKDPLERPNIEEIFNDDWMKEISCLNEKDFKSYEQLMIEEFKRREVIISNENKK